MTYIVRLTLLCLLTCPLVLFAQPSPKKMSIQEAQRLAFERAQAARGGNLPYDNTEEPVEKEKTKKEIELDKLEIEKILAEERLKAIAEEEQRLDALNNLEVHQQERLARLRKSILIERQRLLVLEKKKARLAGIVSEKDETL